MRDVEHEGEDGYVGGEVRDDVFHEEAGGDGRPFEGAVFEFGQRLEAGCCQGEVLEAWSGPLV